MDLLWIALFGLLCAGIFALLSACVRWLVFVPPVALAGQTPTARPDSAAGKSVL